jgi:hypothetical protein
VRRWFRGVLTVAKVLTRLGLIPDDERFSVPPLIRPFASAIS